MHKIYKISTMFCGLKLLRSFLPTHNKKNKASTESMFSLNQNYMFYLYKQNSS